MPFNVSALSALRFTALEDVAPPIQHFLAGKSQLFSRACEEPPRHHLCRRPRRYDRDLGRHEARRQPPADEWPLFNWFARDECLKNGADTCARGVTVAAFFNRPCAVDDAEDHVGGGRDAFFSDDELELANTGGSQPRPQSIGTTNRNQRNGPSMAFDGRRNCFNDTELSQYIPAPIPGIRGVHILFRNLCDDRFHGQQQRCDRRGVLQCGTDHFRGIDHARLHEVLEQLLEYATPGEKRGGVPRPASTAVTYAATATLILLGLASSRRGSRTVSTPALYWALTLPASIVGGSANVRANEP